MFMVNVDMDPMGSGLPSNLGNPRSEILSVWPREKIPQNTVDPDFLRGHESWDWSPLKVILVTCCEDLWKNKTTKKDPPQIVIHHDRIKGSNVFTADQSLWSQTQTQIGNSLEPLSLRHPYNPLLFWIHPDLLRNNFRSCCHHASAVKQSPWPPPVFSSQFSPWKGFYP